MAIYHCSIKIISRGKGKSAVAAAAYRAGEKLTNDRDLFQVQGEKASDRSRANPVYGGARLSERRDERQDRPAGKGMESGVCQADRREGNAQPAVSCAERGSERSRANPQERLQYLAAGTAGAAAPQGAGYGAVTDRAAGIATAALFQLFANPISRN